MVIDVRVTGLAGEPIGRCGGWDGGGGGSPVATNRDAETLTSRGPTRAGEPEDRAGCVPGAARKRK